MTCCTCASSQCRTKRCAYMKAEVECTECCGCKECENHKDLELIENDDDAEEEDHIYE